MAVSQSGTQSGTLPALARCAHPVLGHDHDYDGLLDLVGDRRFVLIGESTHGSQEFYRERARITQRLITECGFNVVALEADWPDAARVRRYTLGRSDDASADEALSDFRRFPAWMWRNTEMVGFVEWLRDHNMTRRHEAEQVQLFGLDLYSLRASIEAVIDYLDTVDPVEARRARERYSCFDHVGAEGQAYGYALAFEGAAPCEDEVVAQLVVLRRNSAAYLGADGPHADDDLFTAEVNAMVVRNAEEYYQQMYRAETSSWNLRDRHMAATLDAIAHHVDRRLGAGQHRAKVVVWEHNSHVGDARATAMGARGELTVGQLARQRYGRDCLLIGLTTFDGSVTAASAWGSRAERWRVSPALTNSHEALLHQVGLPAFWVSTSEPVVANELRTPRLERAIGVVYRPHTERQSHYFPARLADQFDVVLHLDRTSALEPLERTAEWDRTEPPDTFPSGV
jgi:erythromycin esterase-like protein